MLAGAMVRRKKGGKEGGVRVDLKKSGALDDILSGRIEQGRLEAPKPFREYVCVLSFQ